MPRETIKKPTKPKKVLPIDIAAKPSLQNLFKFRTKLGKVSQEKIKHRGFVMNPVGFVQICGVWVFPTRPF